MAVRLMLYELNAVFRSVEVLAKSRNACCIRIVADGKFGCNNQFKEIFAVSREVLVKLRRRVHQLRVSALAVPQP